MDLKGQLLHYQRDHSVLKDLSHPHQLALRAHLVLLPLLGLTDQMAQSPLLGHSVHSDL